MSSRYRKKGKAKFVMLESYMINSLAWGELTANDIAVYIQLKWLYSGTNNGRIAMGCREAADAIRSASKNTGAISLKNLQNKCFIEKAKPSSFHVKSRMATEWRLTEYTCDVTGELPSKGFARWTPEKTTVLPQGQTVLPQGQKAPRGKLKHG